jgi:hypothetical protein
LNAIFTFGVVIHQPHYSPTLLTLAKIVLFKMFYFQNFVLKIIFIFIFKTLPLVGRRPFVQLFMCLSCLYCCGKLLWLRFTRLGVFVTLAPAVFVPSFSVLVFPLSCGGRVTSDVVMIE